MKIAVYYKHTHCQDFYKVLSSSSLQSLEEITSPDNPELRISLGYKFYLSYRVFMAENLQHFHKEETLIMPELHRLYTDEELKKVDKKTYSLMTPEQMLNMLNVLSPHMDPNDIESFLKNIKEFEPEKFLILGDVMKPLAENTI